MRTPLHQLLAGLVCAALCLCAPLAAPAQAPTPESEPTRLLKIVALTRHGVRAPTQKAKTLALWSTRAWPQWPCRRAGLRRAGGSSSRPCGRICAASCCVWASCPKASARRRDAFLCAPMWISAPAPRPEPCWTAWPPAATGATPWPIPTPTPSSIPSSPASTPLTRPRWPAKCCAWPTAT